MDNKIQTSLKGVILKSGKQINFLNPQNISFQNELFVNETITEEATVDKDNSFVDELSRKYQAVRNFTPVIMYKGNDNTTFMIKKEDIAVYIHDQEILDYYASKLNNADSAEVTDELPSQEVLNV